MRMKAGYLTSMILLVLLVPLLFFNSEAEGEAPIADFTYTPEDPQVDEEVTFNASGSFGEDLSYIWDFGDGREARGMIVNHTFRDAREHVVILVVTNSSGGVDTYSEYVYVRDEAPGLIVVGILFAYLFFICGLTLFIGLLSASNLIVGSILAYKTHKMAKKKKMEDEVKPYLIAHLITGIIGFFYYPVVLFAVIAHIVIYNKSKKKMKEIEMKKKRTHKKKKKGSLDDL